MMIKLLSFPHKKIRSKVIKQYLTELSIEKKPIVCFSCGNAAKALKEEGLKTIYIGEKGELTPKKWYNLSEIKQLFPYFFDATSGHLNMELMKNIGEEYKTYLGDLPDTVYIPTGSGETLLCLKLAYPETRFVAVYNLGPETEYSPHAPLNEIIKIIADEVITSPPQNVVYEMV